MVPSCYWRPSERTMAFLHMLYYTSLPSHSCFLQSSFGSLVALTPSSARRRKTSLESGERSSSSNRLPSWPRLGWPWQEYSGRALGLDTKKPKKKASSNFTVWVEVKKYHDGLIVPSLYLSAQSITSKQNIYKWTNSWQYPWTQYLCQSLERLQAWRSMQCQHRDMFHGEYCVVDWLPKQKQ